MQEHCYHQVPGHLLFKQHYSVYKTDFDLNCGSEPGPNHNLATDNLMGHLGGENMEDRWNEEHCCCKKDEKIEWFTFIVIAWLLTIITLTVTTE